MEIVINSQYYRTRTPERQLEIDECLRRNLNHPGISRVVLFCESDAPPVPKGTVPVEVENSDERIAYAEWFRGVMRQDSVITLPLTRFNQGRADLDLNDCPHWKLEVWGVRADAELEFTLWIHHHDRSPRVLGKQREMGESVHHLRLDKTDQVLQVI